MNLRTLSALLVVLPFASAVAAPLSPEPVRPAELLLSRRLPRALDARIPLAYRMARTQTDERGEHPFLGQSVSPQGIRVAIQFSERVAEAARGQLAELGCAAATLPDGRLASVGPILEATCRWEALEPLALRSDVVRVTPTFGFRPLPPQTVPEAPATHLPADVQVDALRRKLRPLGRGEGVTVADMDSGFDPFHPMLFRADGGAYAWIDVDKNGEFNPLMDAVDFNGDGAVESGETLGMIKAQVQWWYGTPRLYNSEGAFVAGVDWLFQDENENGVRDQGPDAPYGDQKPTFGEQLYVADDVNGNGKLDPGEKIIRLNTPKVKAAIAYDQQGNGRVYRRGVDLSKFPAVYPGSEMHGTMVMGTIAGGDPRYLRYAGMAPDVDLLLATNNAPSLVSALAWAKSEGAQIVLWEMATWYWEYLDGSSPLEVACDAATDEGVLQVGAAGNLARSEKHRVKLHAPGTEDVPLVIPSGKAQYAVGNFNWHGAADALAFQVHINGLSLDLAGTTGTVQVGSTWVYWAWEKPSARGTQMLVWQLVMQSGTIPGQTVTFTVTNSGSPVDLHGYVTDSYSSWGKGVTWGADTTDANTYGTPGVGDKTLAIATYFVDFVQAGDTAGGLVHYSSQGPRVDGADSIDFAAPEDHITALSWKGGAPFGSLMVGAGTSNASPVAVGLFAVLKGLRSDATPTELRDLVRNHAAVEDQMGTVPNDLWGYGKVRVYAAQFDGASPAAGQPPLAAGTATRESTALKLDASASTDPDGEPLLYSWDVDYDGVYEVGPSEASAATVSLPTSPVKFAKLLVLDPEGYESTALVPLADPPDAGNPSEGADAGAPAPITVPNPEIGKTPEGCGCSTASSLPLASLLALVALARRRRRA